MMRPSAIFAILGLVVLVIGFVVSSADFLPYLRYRSVSEWSSVQVGCDIRLEHAQDSSCHVLALCSESRWRVLTPWIGDSSKILHIEDFIRIPNAVEELPLDGRMVIRIDGNRVIPLRPGRTRLRVVLPFETDTLSVAVEQSDFGLLVQTVTK